MKKIFKNICLIFVCIFALLINIQVNAEGFSDSTGGLKPTNLGGPCPQCAWVYNSSVNVGIRLGLYKYKNGQKTYYGSIDLYNNASDATYWTLTPAGQKSRLEYSSPSQVYIDKYNVKSIDDLLSFYTEISSCFVDADITASGECAGGILGSDYSYSVKIVSCYTL